MRKPLVITSVALLLAGSSIFAWGTDSDNDGIKDRKDTCSATRVGAKVDKAGCPVDSDTDGVPDGIDRCSKTPAGWPVDESGCPKDSDRDRVVDAQDSCASTPSGARVDAKGCPWDSDGDAVLEGLDRCETTPQGYRVDAHGCPVDSDHDGVNDAMDRCADSRHLETVDEMGCRVKAAALFPPGVQTLRLDGVSFEKNQIEVSPGAGPVLKGIADALKDQPETRVEIAIHTDRAGSASVNRELSERRAAYLANYIVTLGVEPERVSAKGYGETAHFEEGVVELRQASDAPAHN